MAKDTRVNPQELQSPLNPTISETPAVDLSSSTPKKRWPFFVLRGLLYTIMIVCVLGFAFSYKIIFSSNGIFSRQENGFVEQISHLVTSADKQMQGEERDRVNILLVGMGGAGHEGSYLSDTIIVASLKPSTGQVAMLSIPRDLYVEIPGYGQRKINNANAFGYQADPEQGGERLLASVLEEVLDEPIDYYGSVDFSGFIKLIDLVDGLEITVDQAFSDSEYPTTNYGYQTISFKAGPQTMDGAKALKYVRSRHGNNGEGSDFARSARQQKVLAALREKIFSIGTLLNPNRILDISETLGQHVKTDMEIWEILRLSELVKDLNPAEIKNHVLDTSDNGYLKVIESLDGAYIVGPRTGDFKEIQKLADNIFVENPIVEEAASIEIQNGTKVAGLADTTSRFLQDKQLSVIELGNAEDRTAVETTIYDFSLGQKPATIAMLRTLLQAEVKSAPSLLDQRVNEQSGELNLQINTSLEQSEWPQPENKQADIVIVVGTSVQPIIANSRP